MYSTLRLAEFNLEQDRTLCWMTSNEFILELIYKAVEMLSKTLVLIVPMFARLGALMLVDLGVGNLLEIQKQLS